MLDLELLLRTPYVDPSFDISPDGEWVAFAWNRTGQWEIYEIPLAGGEAHQVSHGPGGKFSPKYAPDGQRMAFVVDWDGGENFDLFVMERVSGKAHNLTPDTPFAFQPNYAWLLDGQHIACLADPEGRFKTYLLDVASCQMEKLFECPGPAWDLELSPDGQLLAVVAEGLGQDYFCYIVPIDRRPAQVVAQDGKPINAKQVCWQAGEALAFSSDVSEQYEIGVFHTSDGRLTWLTQAGQGDQGEPDFSPDGRWMACVLSDGPETWLTLRDLESATVQRYEIEPGIHAGPAFTPDGRSLVLLFDNPRHPPDLWRFDLAAGAFYPLTTSLPASLTPDDFVMPQHVQYDSPDGRCVPALLFLPDDFRRALAGGPAAPPPAVVIIHGGPSWLFQYLWYPVMAHCASRGWTVLAPNYRGSTGYGRAWQYANRFEMGNLDTLDVAAGVDYLVSHGLADPQRVGVTGRSHGGFLTMSCLTRYPEIFAVGSAIVPFLNWFTSHAGSRDDLKHWDLENMGSPLENADLWRERSPYFFLDRIRVPVQMVCGANDPRCPASESIAARDRLLELGKEVELLLYEDEGHAFLKVENVVDHELKRISFLARVLDQDR